MTVHTDALAAEEPDELLEIDGVAVEVHARCDAHLHCTRAALGNARPRAEEEKFRAGFCRPQAQSLLRSPIGAANSSGIRLSRFMKRWWGSRLLSRSVSRWPSPSCIRPFCATRFIQIMLAFQSVPKVAIAPLLALWIGFGTLPKVVVVFLVCFFPIIVATATGLAAVPAPLMDLIRSLSASTLQTFMKIRFPTAMPHIFVGLKIAITFAVIGAVIGEFVGSEDGLGYLILVSTSQSRTPLAFAALVLLTVMSIVLYYGIAFLERIVVPWAPKN